MPEALTEIVQAGFDARLRALRVPGPLVTQGSPSCHTARRSRGVRAPAGPGRAKEEAASRGAELAGDDWIALVPDAVERSKMRCLRT
jgi:hypothetical protein